MSVILAAPFSAFKRKVEKVVVIGVKIQTGPQTVASETAFVVGNLIDVFVVFVFNLFGNPV